jgi:hypothetical protein
MDDWRVRFGGNCILQMSDIGIRIAGIVSHYISY